MNLENIRNFCIIAHIDAGKSTLADRFLEITKTIESREMKAQFLDQLELERERGITIKMAPVRMIYHPHRGLTRTETRTNADDKLLYADITYKIRGAIFAVKKNIGLEHKEIIYQKALEEEFKKIGLDYKREKSLDIFYENKKIGIYKPDFIVENKIIIELKALPFVAQNEEVQLWNYIKGSNYRLGLLVNFGGKDVTIKRIIYDLIRFPRQSASSPRESAKVEEYILNLIDTPGHPDFGYEVSRAFKAVEGAILLVDASQGIQAQTLANFEMAKKAGLKIIGAVNKIDLFQNTDKRGFTTQISAENELNIDDNQRIDPRLSAVLKETADLIGCPEDEIFRISGKTGEGVEELLEAIIGIISPPLPRKSAFVPRSSTSDNKSALVFDSLYDDHKGVIAFVRVFGGEFKSGDETKLIAANIKFKIKEAGYFSPKFRPAEKIKIGEIGYIATGIKDPDKLRIGDSIGEESAGGYEEIQPRVFVSFFPEDGDKYEELKKSFQKLKLSDPSLKLEPDANEVLGRGFKVGFLGKLHFEITSQRLEKEFSVKTINSFPSVSYRIRRGTTRTETRTNAEIQINPAFLAIENPNELPEDVVEIWEPMIDLEILAPTNYLGSILKIKNLFRMGDTKTQTMGERVLVQTQMPLSELISDFDDQLKSLTHGFASFSYKLTDYKKADLVKTDVLIAGEKVMGLSRVVPKDRLEYEARQIAQRLKNLLPKQQFAQAVQVANGARIIARETIPAMKKDVTGYLYGGDRTRKMKLWKKQQRGKKKLLSRAKVNISPEVFKELLKK